MNVRILGESYVYRAIGSRLQLNCTVPRGRTVGWYLDGVVIRQSDDPNEGFFFPAVSGQSVSVLEKARLGPADFGVYKCKLIAEPQDQVLGASVEYTVEVKRINGRFHVHVVFVMCSVSL